MRGPARAVAARQRSGRKRPRMSDRAPPTFSRLPHRHPTPRSPGHRDRHRRQAEDRRRAAPSLRWKNTSARKDTSPAPDPDAPLPRSRLRRAGLSCGCEQRLARNASPRSSHRPRRSAKRCLPRAPSQLRPPPSIRKRLGEQGRRHRSLPPQPLPCRAGADFERPAPCAPTRDPRRCILAKRST